MQVGERDEGSGNVELLVDVLGPELGPDDYYALWLEQDGEWTATCGYFAVGEGETSVRMTIVRLPRLRRGSSRQPTGMTPSRS